MVFQHAGNLQKTLRLIFEKLIKNFHMRVQIIPIKELPIDIEKKWLSIQDANADIFGPCFHPELFKAVGDILPDVYVAVLHKYGRIAGFMPFLRKAGSRKAKWIEMCFYQGIISSPMQGWNLNKILRKCGFNIWEVVALSNFRNLKGFRGQFVKKNLPCVNLNSGWEKYVDYLKNKGIGYRTMMYRERLAERKLGPIRFVPESNDIEVLNRLVPWKVGRHNTTEEWERVTNGILDRLFYLRNSALSGHLSALYAGEELLGATFNLKYKGIMQLYVIGFNPMHAKYSPGLLLLYKVLQEHKALKFNVFDFGAGKERYKQDFSNCSYPIIEGTLKGQTFKEKIKSMESVYRYIRPVSRLKGKIVNKVKCMTKS